MKSEGAKMMGRLRALRKGEEDLNVTSTTRAVLQGSE